MHNLANAALVVCGISILVFLYNQGNTNITNEKSIQKDSWDKFSNWLDKNGVQSKLTLAYFNDTGRGVATTEDIEEGKHVVEIPFQMVLNTKYLSNTKLGKALHGQSNKEEALLSIFLFYETLQGNKSFWKPYIDLLLTPHDFVTMPQYFTEKEKKTLDGPMRKVWNEEIGLILQEIYNISAKVEREHAEFKGLADVEGLRWANAVVHSRVWALHELPGKTLIPLADLANHHPTKGVTLSVDTKNKRVMYISKARTPKGSEFFFKYYPKKTSSDHIYFLTYGFRMNINDINTYQILFNYGSAKHNNIKEILLEKRCENVPETFSDSFVELPQAFMECLGIYSLETLDESSKANITQSNYRLFVSSQVKWRAQQLARKIFDNELAKFKLNDEDELLLNPDLSQNMRNILLVRKSEKKVLQHSKNLLDLYH